MNCDIINVMKLLTKLVKDYWMEVGGILILIVIYIYNSKEISSLTNRLILLVILVLVSIYYLWSKFKIINKDKVKTDNYKYSESELAQIEKQEDEFLKTVKEIDDDLNE